MNKKKIINDPLYGFITIPNDFLYDLVNHPYFQRLRRIKQLGLADYVYPGANHTRFQHAIGAMYLMGLTLDNLRQKGIDISEEEYNASLAAILLHDIGHSPFSHALEHVLLKQLDHETISLIIVQALNSEFSGDLTLAIQIFKGEYQRKFFHQLVTSQLDIDRLDYLNRDSYFTGVVEGHISANRIIKLLHVSDDEIVVEEKGIYSIENFLSARRLMYWQVYLHKTTVGIESMLTQIIRRARKLGGADIPHNPSLEFFLQHDISGNELASQRQSLDAFCSLDDYDLLAAIKYWRKSEDQCLSFLCNMLVERKLFKVELAEEDFSRARINEIQVQIAENTELTDEDVAYYVIHGIKSNKAYIGGGQKINVLTKKGKTVDIAIASDLPNIKAMRNIVKKYFLCYPKDIFLGKHDT